MLKLVLDVWNSNNAARHDLSHDLPEQCSSLAQLGSPSAYSTSADTSDAPIAYPPSITLELSQSFQVLSVANVGRDVVPQGVHDDW